MKREDFLSKAKVSVKKEIEIDDVGTITAVSVTGRDQVELMKIIAGVKDGDKDAEQKMLEFNKEIIKRSIVDESGNPMFESTSEISELPLKIIKQLLQAANDISGMSPESQKEIEKN